MIQVLSLNSILFEAGLTDKLYVASFHCDEENGTKDNKIVRHIVLMCYNCFEEIRRTRLSTYRTTSLFLAIYDKILHHMTEKITS